MHTKCESSYRYRFGAVWGGKWIEPKWEPPFDWSLCRGWVQSESILWEIFPLWIGAGYTFQRTVRLVVRNTNNSWQFPVENRRTESNADKQSKKAQCTNFMGTSKGDDSVQRGPVELLGKLKWKATLIRRRSQALNCDKLRRSDTGWHGSVCYCSRIDRFWDRNNSAVSSSVRNNKKTSLIMCYLEECMHRSQS